MRLLVTLLLVFSCDLMASQLRRAIVDVTKRLGRPTPSTTVALGPITPWAKQMPPEDRHITTEPFDCAVGSQLRSHSGWWTDLTAQYGVTNLGFDYRRVTRAALAIHARGLSHLQSDIDHPLRRELNDRLLAFANFEPGSRCYFTLGGNNAVDAALALVREHKAQTDPGRGDLIAAFKQSYHGASSAMPCELTGEDDRRRAHPHSGKVVHVNHPEILGEDGTDRISMVDVIQEIGPEQFTAIVIEGGGFTATSGGYRVPEDYLREVFNFAERHGITIINDETYSGFGRTGKPFGIDNYEGLHAPVMAGSKALTNGVGTTGYVCLAPEYAKVFDDQPMTFGQTFSPLADMACGVEVTKAFQSLEGQDLLAGVERTGQFLRDQLVTKLGDTPFFGAVRQHGLIVILELINPLTERPFTNAELFALKQLLATPAFKTITMGRKDKLMFSPALVITPKLIDHATTALRLALYEVAIQLNIPQSYTYEPKHLSASS